jgi:uncharacterized membrane protein YhhN
VNEARSRILVALAALGAVAWWATLLLAAVPAWALAFKALAVLPLGALALARRSEAGALLGLGLLAHACGDLLLEVTTLVAAVASFGTGHLLYAVLFGRRMRSWEEVGGGAKVGLGLLALLAGLLLPPVLDAAPAGLRLPVGGYVALLVAMAALALVSGRGQPWVALGALAFVLSDALLGMQMFGLAAGLGRGLTWPLYWGGQLAIALGWLAGSDPEAAGPAPVT